MSETNPTEPGTPRDKQWLQECCELVRAKMPENYSFVVFGFPTCHSDRCYYASNAAREDVIAALAAWIANNEAQFGKHIENAKSGAQRIAVERARQIAEEGYTEKHDDAHGDGALTRAALAYLMHEHCHPGMNQAAFDEWPWNPDSWKPGADPIRNLTKAGALIAAEIDRLQRAKINP